MTTFDLDHLARLSQLDLPAHRRDGIARDLTGLFVHIEKLAEVDVSGIEPSAHAEALLAPLREDRARPSQPQQAALANAPQTHGDQFVVPRVVGEE